jgi:hypothetical protein
MAQHANIVAGPAAGGAAVLLLLLLLLLVARPALAGVGGSVVTLAECAAAGGDRTFQRWAYSADKKSVAVANDSHALWSSTWCLSSGFGIGTLPSAAAGEVFTSPCGSAFALTLSPDAPRTALALADGSGLCLEAAAAQRGTLLRLAPCASPTPDAQAFSYASATGTLLHAPSGLCVDAGSRFRACGGAGAPGAGLPFCDATLAVDARVADLVARLSFDEKVSMLATPSGGSPSLGVSPTQWWQESLHGVANNVGVAFDAPTPASTSFPQPILSACSYNRSLWHATAAAISDEVRAFANAGHSGLTLWAPNINIARDPRWGRVGSPSICHAAGYSSANVPRHFVIFPATSSPVATLSPPHLRFRRRPARTPFSAAPTPSSTCEVCRRARTRAFSRRAPAASTLRPTRSRTGRAWTATTSTRW